MKKQRSEKTARVVLRIAESVSLLWEGFSFRGDINLVQCFPGGKQRECSVHDSLLLELVKALKIDPKEMRLANCAQQENSALRNSPVLITVFFDRMVGNGVLSVLQQHMGAQTRSGLNLGKPGGIADVVSIDLADVAGTPPHTPPSSKHSAQSLGQGFLFGIIQEEANKDPIVVQAS